MRAFPAVCAVLQIVLTTASVAAEPVLEIQAEEVEALVAADHGDRLLVVHYSSDDGSCSFCVDSNDTVQRAAGELADRFVFAQVLVNPWRAYFEEGHPAAAYQQRIGYRLTGVPAAMVFSRGQPLRLITSIGPEFSAELESARDLAMQQATAPRGPVAVSRVQPDKIAAFLQQPARDRPVVLTISSTDLGCPHCIEANSVVEETSRYLADSYTFLHVELDPWQSFATDEALTAFLAAQGATINGVPTTFLVNEGRLLGQMPTLRGDLRTILVQVLPGIGQ